MSLTRKAKWKNYEAGILWNSYETVTSHCDGYYYDKKTMTMLQF
jgi:hypothetical protein